MLWFESVAVAYFATLAATAGFVGAVAGATLASLLADAGRLRRFVSPAIAGAATAVLVVRPLLGV